MREILAVSIVPFAIGLVVASALFGAATWFLVQESRRPVDWAHVDARATAPLTPHLSHTRLAAVCLVFAVWSLWATARPVSGWR
jgi:hypothetical protein